MKLYRVDLSQLPTEPSPSRSSNQKPSKVRRVITSAVVAAGLVFAGCGTPEGAISDTVQVQTVGSLPRQEGASLAMVYQLDINLEAGQKPTFHVKPDQYSKTISSEEVIRRFNGQTLEGRLGLGEPYEKSPITGEFAGDIWQEALSSQGIDPSSYNNAPDENGRNQGTYIILTPHEPFGKNTPSVYIQLDQVFPALTPDGTHLLVRPQLMAK